MPFAGKATFSAGAALPEIAEDVADIVSIVSPFETPLLDHLGDARRAATSTRHEWLEDDLLPNTDRINQASFSPDPSSATTFVVENGASFTPGDQIRAEGAQEVMLVTDVVGDTLSVVRAYGGTPAAALADDQSITILGGSALEGADRPAPKFTNRRRLANYTQIFTKSVEVSGSQLAARTIALADEMDYQKQERLRELLRDLENCVINGVAPQVDPEGTDSVRRTMRGVLPSIQTNEFVVGVDPIPVGSGLGQDLLNEEVLNTALRTIWEQSGAIVDIILVGGAQKRRINNFIGETRSFGASDTMFRDQVSMYASDFGVARVILSRWVPPDACVLLDSSRLDVLPLSGRSFHFKQLASGGDSEIGQLIGEYTLEMRNENAHGVIRGLGAL